MQLCRTFAADSVIAWLWALVVTATGAALMGDDLQLTAPPVSEPPLLIERGKAIYAEQCASCHGDQGEGVAGAYDHPLVGDVTLTELRRLISTTMPKDEAEQCVGEAAAAVAAYVHQTFFRDAAELHDRSPRIGLARLTAGQLRQSLADLYAHFEGVPAPTDQQGVKGIYFNGAAWKDEHRKFERTEPVIDFDFGHDRPGEGVEAKSFFVHWQGGVRADVTGRYELIVRSTCSFVMDFGRIGRNLFDNHVQSGDRTEFRRTLTLTAGRIYPFKIDFVQRERKGEAPPARISLFWIPPHGIEEVIPGANLTPTLPPPTFSLQAILPPDDRSYGYERGIGINRQWDDSTTAAALEFAEAAIHELWPQYHRGHRDEGDENQAILRAFLTELVETAFRTPLDDEVRRLYVDQQVDGAAVDSDKIRRTVLMVIKSPRFLYPLADQHQPDSYRVANRLALTMFDSLPADDWLRKLAAGNGLETVDAIRTAAQTMLADYRTQAKTQELMLAWLNLGQEVELHKDGETFPDFDQALVHDLRTSLNAFLHDAVWGESGDFRQLFLADWSYTTERLARFYGESWKPADENAALLRRTTSGAARPQHLGLLNHPLIMSRLAYHNATSPIHRGVFLMRYVLGRTLRPPSEAFAPLSPDLHPDLTTRERVALQTSPESCQVCHSKINELGFVLENFDAVGRYRAQEGEKAIDSVGSYTDRAGNLHTFADSHQLAKFLAESHDSQRAFVNRAFHHLVKQPAASFGPDTMDILLEKFRDSGWNIPQLIVEIAVVAASEPLNAGTRSANHLTSPKS